MTMDQVYARTQERSDYIRHCGYKLEEIWECELEKVLDSYEGLRELYKGIEVVEPITDREFLFGGRTNACCLYYKVEEGEKIHYLDVCSLVCVFQCVCVCIQH